MCWPKNVFNVILSPGLCSVLLQYLVPLNTDSSIGFFLSKIKALKSHLCLSVRPSIYRALEDIVVIQHL